MVYDRWIELVKFEQKSMEAWGDCKGVFWYGFDGNFVTIFGEILGEKILYIFFILLVCAHTPATCVPTHERGIGLKHEKSYQWGEKSAFFRYTRQKGQE